MKNTTINGEVIDWNNLGDTQIDIFRPDSFHVSDTEAKRFAYSRSAGIPHATTLPNIQENFVARGAMLEALINCLHRSLASQYYRETLLAAMAPFVYRISNSEDSFQKGILAIWAELLTWVDKYPIDHFREDPAGLPFDAVLDDVVKYLSVVAKNAMSGRKRKATLFDDALVINAADTQVVEYNVNAAIDELTNKPQERRILQLKSERKTEEQIGNQVGLNRHQVNRKVSRLYKKCCAMHGLGVKPMGRAARKPLILPLDTN